MKLKIKPKFKKVKMNEDDPFANIFLQKQEDQIKEEETAVEDKGKSQRSKEEKVQNSTSEITSEVEESECSKEEDDSANSNVSGKDEQVCDWKNKAYWSLPENVRAAIDLAKAKKKHSDFYYKLKVTNDKIQVYT